VTDTPDIRVAEPADNRWREPNGQLCVENKASAMQTIFGAFDRGLRGEDCRAVWAHCWNGFHLLAIPRHENEVHDG
jgi:hypothetical protein